MKSTGIVRKADRLGRVVIPRELRRTMQIEDGGPVEIFIDADQIVLKKYEPGCVVCGSMDDIIAFRGKAICKQCRTMLKEEK